jgi:hypothetical protein
VGAVAGAFDFAAELNEGGEFLVAHVVAGLDRRFAGHHVEDLVEGLLVSGGEAVGLGFFDEFGEKLDGVDTFIEEEGREGVDGDGRGTDGFGFDADACE